MKMQPSFDDTNKSLCPVNLNELKRMKDPREPLWKSFMKAKNMTLKNLLVEEMRVQNLYQILRVMGFIPSEYQLHDGFEYACFDSKYIKPLKKLKKQSNREDIHIQSKEYVAPPLKDNIGSQFSLKNYIDWLSKNLCVLKFDHGFSKEGSTTLSNRPISNKNDILKRLNTEQGSNDDNNRRQHRFQTRQDEIEGQFGRDRRAKTTALPSINLLHSPLSRAHPNYTEKKVQRYMAMKDQIGNLTNIFDRIDVLRRENGLMPLDGNSSSSSDDDDYDLTEEEKRFRSKARKKQRIRCIPYEPDMYELNREIGSLRMEASQEIESFIQKCKYNPEMNLRLEKGLTKFHNDRVEANERIGKIGAVHAQKRLVRFNNNQTTKDKNDEQFINQHETNLLRNMRIDFLMSKSNKPPMNFKMEIQPGSEYERRLNRLMKQKQNGF